MTPEEAAAQLDIEFEPDGRGPVGHVIDALGQTYHYLRFGDGPPTVFLHGGGPGCTGWTDFGQVAPLFAQDRDVVLLDLLQYGRSSKPSISGPMWDYHATHLLAVLDALELDRVDLICNSWGGTQALRLATLAPERINAMVITGSMPLFHGPMAPLLDRSRRGRIARDRYYGGPEGPTNLKMRELMTELEWFDGLRIPEATVSIRYRQSLEPDEINCGQQPAHRGEWQDLGPHLELVRAPTLFAWGMYDGFLTPDYALMLASRVDRGQLYVMDKCSHHLQEERPEHYYAVAAAFLGNYA